MAAMVVAAMDKHRLRQGQAILSDLLRELRQDAGLRQQDLAARLGEPQSFVSKYESGERRLDMLELRCICAVLGLSLSDLAQELERRLQATDSAT
jgi:transcriptional regulator with XRE-family HTH domain